METTWFDKCLYMGGKEKGGIKDDFTYMTRKVNSNAIFKKLGVGFGKECKVWFFKY